MIQKKNFQFMRISLASPELIRSWAEKELPNGELVGRVTKPYTIHYQTQKPEKDGLFCERIFGPIKSGVCSCGKYQGIFNNVDNPQFCEQCGVELTESRMRRYQMGYIHLECPVSHVWYLKNRPSLIALLLNQPIQDIDSLVYYDSFLAKPVTNKPTLMRLLAVQSKLYKEQRQNLFYEPLPLFLFDESWQQALDRYFSSKWVRFIQKREMLTGAEVVYKLLKNLDLQKILFSDRTKCKNMVKRMPENYNDTIKTTEAVSQEEQIEKDETIYYQKRIIVKRIMVIRDLLQAKVKPEWTILINLPVLPADLRPIVELKDGQLIRSDLNELYRIVLQRNQSISQLSIEAPSCISMMQKRLLQEAVDALLANGASGNIIRDRNMKPYKSLSDIIKGKKGRFRENLLGKRVDYSGRSVIVVGPSLSLHQCGIPAEMAIELFQPFLIRKLIVNKWARNPRTAKNMIKQKISIVWKTLRNIVNNHVIVLNRAPTLHRLGVQAFQPILVRERAIHLHPLVCTGFNADFDGDQMAVHVPLSLEAQAEAHLLMMPYLNLVSPATGDAIAIPSQDMLLGLYTLTLGAKTGIYSNKNRNHYNSEQNREFNQFLTFKNYSDVFREYQQRCISTDSFIWLYWVNNIFFINSFQNEHPIEVQYEAQGSKLHVYENCQINKNKIGKLMTKYMRTTVGRVILNQQIEQATQGVQQHVHKTNFNKNGY